MSIRSNIISLGMVTSLSLIALAGCTTHGHQRIDRTRNSLAQTRTELLMSRGEIQSTLGTLKKISTTRQGDLRPMYEHFIKSIGNIESQANRTRRRADQITKNSNRYLQAWGEEISAMQNPKIRRRSTQQKAEVRQDFLAVTKSLHGVGSAYRPFISDIRDIQMALNHALNPRGVASVTDVIQQAKQDGHVVKRQIDQAIAKIDRVRQDLSPSAGGVR